MFAGIAGDAVGTWFAPRDLMAAQALPPNRKVPAQRRLIQRTGLAHCRRMLSIGAAL